MGRGIALAGALAVAYTACAPKGCFEDGKKPGIARTVGDEIANRLLDAAKIDASDGSDDFDEKSLAAKNQAFLAKLAQENPTAHRTFLLRVKKLLLTRKKPAGESDLDAELDVLDLEQLYKLLERRNALVQPDGTIKFPSAAAEKNTSLADLTPDEEIYFEALNPRTLDAIGISLKEPKPFKVFRVRKETDVRMGQKTVRVKPGTFVVATSDGTLYKILIFDGDRIYDSLSQDFAEPSERFREGSNDFEAFLKVKMQPATTNRSRKIFHENFPSYVEILKDDYEELLSSDGIPFDKHFVYYLQWLDANGLPPSEDSARAFFDAILAAIRKNGKSAESASEDGAEGKGEEPKSGVGTKINEIIDKAVGMLRGEPDSDEDALSYHDQRSRSLSETAEVERKKHGALFAIVRLQGSFFGNYAYNRLSGNYTAKVSVADVNGREYLNIRDIGSVLNDKSMPKDVKAAMKPTSFVDRLNATTNYNHSIDAELRTDLAFSETNIGDSAAGPERFQTLYAPDGSITAIMLDGKPYNPQGVIVPPERLKQLPGNRASVAAGGITITADLDAYFSQYHALEAVNRGKSQMIVLYNKKDKKITKMRNPEWFVEKEAVEVYRQIAELITVRYAGDDAKALAIGAWLTANLDYISEITEINKIALAALIDGGGDCEDGYTAYRALAHAAGLGSSVGGVIFDGHIAPMVRGSHGATKYVPEGSNDTWTIVEVAASRGTKIAPGETPHRNPLLFIMPDGKLVPATSDIVVMETVPLDEIDGRLVDGVDKAIGAMDAFISNPANKPTEENLDKSKSMVEEMDPIVKGVTDAYDRIAETGKTAEALSDKISAAMARANKFIAEWAALTEHKADEARRLEVRNAPAEVRASIDRFHAQLEIITTNIGPAAEKIQRLLLQYRGRENDASAMVALYNAILEIINEAKISTAFDNMAHEYHETLKHFDPTLEASCKEILEDAQELVNKGPYAALNRVGSILKQRHGY